MSSIKQYIFDLEKQAKSDWIQEKLGDFDADESSPGWSELEQEYASIMESKEAEAEYLWYLENSYSHFYEKLRNELNSLHKVLKGAFSQSTEQVVLKMSYVHAVTILESFISDYIKTLIVKNDYLLNNLLNSESISNKKLNFGEQRFALKDVYNSKTGVVGITLEELSKVSFHNITHVTVILKAMFNSDFQYSTRDIGMVGNLRHDFVHRNGVDKNGKEIVLQVSDVLSAIETIDVFAGELHSFVIAELNA
ncbi:HEPN domain-containing protein [Vibrio parahaemolyticus]|nr:hypothetical protein [Vibrio parahaemolyticus]